MTVNDIEIDFSRIRPFGNPASRPGAFEELSSLLVTQLPEWPANTKFNRFGNPDSGREGKGTLPTGDVWAWQAKYLFVFDSSAVDKITKSLASCIAREPQLKKYFVALPIDLPDGSVTGTKSAFIRWNQAVEAWEEMAKQAGLEVEFIYFGLNQMTSLLTKSENAGRVEYWFNQEVLSREKQLNQVNDTIAKAGPRYMPKLHINVESAQTLDAVGQTPQYFNRWRETLASLRAPHRNPWGLHSSQSEYFKAPLSTCNSALLAVDANIQQIILGAPDIPDLEGLEHALSVALAHVDKALDLLSTHSRINGGYYVGEAAMLHNDLVRAQYALEDAESLMISVDTSAAHHGELLLTGDAGVGKTHLLCDVALDRIRSGKPTMMVLGQNFEGAFPLLQLPSLLGFHGTIDDLLELLNAAGEAEQHKALLIIDAINESRAPQHWADAVRELRSKASRFAYVGIVISCRSGFVDDLLEDTDMPKAIHRGFEPSMNAAVQHFTKVYGLEMPTFPIFNPEFGNPLFLRLTCESIKTQGLTRFQPGSNGISSICDSFLDSVNLQLSKPNRCNFNAKKNLVHSAVRQIAQFDEMHLESSVVEAITDEILPGRNLWTSHLMKGLIDEGLLIEIGDSHVAFGYQRLGEIARTKEIASKSIQEIQEWLSGKLAHQYAVRGTLNALAVTLPENHDVELIDLLNVDGAESWIAVYGFIESLTSREPSSIRPRTLALVEALLAIEYFASELRSQLIRLACIPDHPLNANFLHVYLVSQDLSDRDTEWSAWLFRALETEEKSPVKTLIEWAWPLNDEDVYGMDAETAYLATLTMGWCLSTSDRAVRDSATKALVSIGEKYADSFCKALKLLLSANDPYVTERILAAACGIALRNPSVGTLMSLAEISHNFISDGWPAHLLTRDYLKRIFVTASEAGWAYVDSSNSETSEWSPGATSRDEIKKMTAKPDFRYSAIWHSLDDYGDFGRYIVGPAIKSFSIDSNLDLVELAPRLLFDRVRQLGWSPEKFDRIDRHIHRSRQNDTLERLGKKYQWIAFYELLGELSMHFKVGPKLTSQESGEFQYAEQIVWRDIDVTVLRRKHLHSVEKAWFLPAKGDFPNYITDEYPQDMSGVPDPIDLLSLTDSSGVQWISLHSSPTWSQKHSPEVEILQPPKRHMWMNLHSYLVPTASLSTLTNWAIRKDWHGRWMPEIAESANLLLGSYPSDPQWSSAEGPLNEWELLSTRDLPVELIQSGAVYQGTGTNRDASAERETGGYVPSKALFECLGLEHGVDFEWKRSGLVSITDPSTRYGGQGTLLLRRDDVSYISEAGYSLFWTVLTGNELDTNSDSNFRRDHEWITGSASYVFKDGAIQLVDSQAVRTTTASNSDEPVDWDLKLSDRSNAGLPRD